MQKLNFRTKDYSHIYFSSDFHIDHKRDFIFKPRGFDSWEDHTEFVVKNLLSLQPDDLLIYLGDFALNTSDERVQSLLDAIPCETYMCWGNHNSGLKTSYQRAKNNYLAERFDDVDIYPLKIARNVTMMGDAFYVSIDRRKFYCNHFAPTIWDGMQHGWGCVCGHSHGSLEIANYYNDEMKLLDVGIDNALKYHGKPLFEFKDVCEIMDKKTLYAPDHHA
jgi:calcineurin-like phosphoesterase family protein